MDKVRVAFGRISKSSSSSSDTQRTSSGSIATSSDTNSRKDVNMSEDPMFLRLRREAVEVAKREPFMCILLSKVGLLDASDIPSFSTDPMMQSIPLKLSSKAMEPAKSFNEAISRIVSQRLSACSGGSENVCPLYLCHLIEGAFASEDLELGHTMSEAVREDANAVFRRDPACETLLEAVLFMKGFLSLVIHRAARRAWKPDADAGETGDNGGASLDGSSNDVDAVVVRGARFVALLLQSQASSAFGVDIHPAAQIGAGVMIDHATGVVIGETATVGDGTTILHGVTLGGTGKESGDRHPKVGKDVLIGAGTKILGNISVGDRAKIGAGSIVLRAIPTGATAVGSPARIIGFTPKGERPGSSVDIHLDNVEPLVSKASPSLSDIITVESTDDISSLEAIKETTESETSKNVGDTEKSASNEESNDSDKETGTNDDDGENKDDEITDFGTPAKCRWVNPKGHDDDMCPFRNSFRRLSSSSKDAMSHTKLRTLLLQHGCSENEIVEVFFELLHCVPASSSERQEGCIPLDIFSKCFVEIASEKTGLDLRTCEAIAKGDLRTLMMSKTASRKFRSTFSKLGSLSERVTVA